MSTLARSRYHRSGRRLVVVLCMLWLAAGCGKEAPKAPPSAPPEVKVLTVAPRDVPAAAVYVAQTQSSQAVNIQARVSGFLDKRMYVEGSVVKAGQVLFQMDQKPFQAQVAAAQAALLRNQAAAEVAKANLARTRPLAAQNALSQKDLDDARGQYEQAAAAVEQSKAQLLEAQLDLSYTTIRSPIEGVSSYAAIADGTYLSPQNAQLTTVYALSPMWINFSISENEMERVRNDVRKGLLKFPDGGRFIVEIEMVDGSRFPFTGRITFADPTYSSATGTFLLRATVENPAGLLRPNQYVRARLTGAIRPHAIVVPQRAVQQGSKSHFVWVIDGQNKAEQRPVVVGDWYGDDNWIVTEGLHSGDQVVVDGGMRLTPGAMVTAKPYVPAIAATSRAPALASASTLSNAHPQLPSVTAVYFARGSSSLDADAVDAVREVAAATMGIGTLITLTGHADRTGSRPANAKLAQRRANAVKDALVANGIAAQRIRLAPSAEVIGSGTDDEARRVDIGLAK